jgi:hypothetical protein
MQLNGGYQSMDLICKISDKTTKGEKLTEEERRSIPLLQRKYQVTYTGALLMLRKLKR